MCCTWGCKILIDPKWKVQQEAAIQYHSIFFFTEYASGFISLITAYLTCCPQLRLWGAEWWIISELRRRIFAEGHASGLFSRTIPAFTEGAQEFHEMLQSE
jgi:hypothetical protein